MKIYSENNNFHKKKKKSIMKLINYLKLNHIIVHGVVKKKKKKKEKPFSFSFLFSEIAEKWRGIYMRDY